MFGDGIGGDYGSGMNNDGDDDDDLEKKIEPSMTE